MAAKRKPFPKTIFVARDSEDAEYLVVYDSLLDASEKELPSRTVATYVLQEIQEVVVVAHATKRRLSA